MMTPFVLLLKQDSALRDAYVAFLDGEIARENTLDQVDAQRSVDYQRGKVAKLRFMRSQATAMDKPSADQKGETP